jgi:ribosomal protein S18 acetylase RimI-like enzyme
VNEDAPQEASGIRDPAGTPKRWTLERGTLWERKLTGEPAPRVAPAVPVRWEEAGPPSGGALAAAQALASAMSLSDPVPVLRRLRSGARAFAAWVDGSIACFGWVSSGSERIGELERHIRLPAGEAYVWDCLTLPAYRRLGLYTSLLTHIGRTLQAEGFRRLWIGSALANQPSIRGFEAAGFRPVLRVVYVRVGTFSLFAARRFPPAPHDRSAAARAALARDDEKRLGPLLVGRVRPPKQPSGAGADLQ